MITPPDLPLHKGRRRPRPFPSFGLSALNTSGGGNQGGEHRMMGFAVLNPSYQEQGKGHSAKEQKVRN